MHPDLTLPSDCGFVATGITRGETATRMGPSRTAAFGARGVLTVTMLAVVWTLCNPYFEIDHSSLIYTGRAIADLDPSGVGHDAMFRYDGQAGFTAFTRIYRILVSQTDLSTATFVISIAAVIAGFLGATALATAIGTGRTRTLSIIFAAALPVYYGGYKLFSYAETAATPRPFTEALVLCGLAAMMRGRLRLAAGIMVAATILHPIMALAGVLVLAAWLVLEDWRWLFAFTAVGAAVLAAAVVHLGPFDRLTTVMDPDWTAVLTNRNPHLFPSLWPDGWMGRLSARAATIIVAAAVTTGPVRRLFLLSLAVGLAGLATAYLVDQRLPIVLLVQAQTWRTLWLVFVVAAMAGAICTVKLWAFGGTSRIVLALLALCWIYADHDQAAMVLAATALGFHFCVQPAQYRMSNPAVIVVLAIAALIGILGLVLDEAAILQITTGVPRGFAGEARHVFGLDWDYTPLAVLAAITLTAWTRRVPNVTLATLTACGLILVATTWDRRSTETRFFDTGGTMPALAEIVNSKPGEVFWIGGVQESWRWLGRANWVSPIQGAGLVFSRPLAMIYSDRADRAVAAGLDDGSLLKPFDGIEEVDRLRFEKDRLATFCAYKDAPTWIVVPSDATHNLPVDMHPWTWTLPVPRLTPMLRSDGTMSWAWTRTVEIAACSQRPLT
jgi:hypothetical protein